MPRERIERMHEKQDREASGENTRSREGFKTLQTTQNLQTSAEQESQEFRAALEDQLHKLEVQSDTPKQENLDRQTGLVPDMLERRKLNCREAHCALPKKKEYNL